MAVAEVLEATTSGKRRNSPNKASSCRIKRERRRKGNDRGIEYPVEFCLGPWPSMVHCCIPLYL